MKDAFEMWKDLGGLGALITKLSNALLIPGRARSMR